MDPFSLIVGGVTLAQVCGSTAKELHDLRRSYKKFDSEMESLAKVIDSLASVTETVSNVCKENQHRNLRLPEDKQRIHKLCGDLERNFDDSSDYIKDLRTLLDEIKGEPDSEGKISAKFGQLKKVLRRERREDEMNDIRGRIQECYTAIDISLTALNLFYVQALDESTKTTIGEAKLELSELYSDLISQLKIDLLAKVSQNQEEIRELLSRRASTVAIYATSEQAGNVNRYYHTPQSVVTYFTGREHLLEELKRAFDPRSPDDGIQPRQFVVQGLPGSGKTQFCCQFASLVRELFWAVFWIDASSRESADSTFCVIAAEGKVAPNMKAAKDWLANSKAPWLLLIDNADDTDIPIEEYFPPNPRGCILITTRNPAHQVHGNVGRNYFVFNELEHKDAENLLLRAAHVKKPCANEILEAAKHISEHMCYLPLALNYAGTVIREKLCEWKDYLTYYKTKQSEYAKNYANKAFDGKPASEAVFQNFELLLGQMQKIVKENGAKAQRTNDAIEFMQLFSFFHHRNIRLRILLQSIENPHNEQLISEQKPADPGREKPSRRPAARTTLLNKLVELVEMMINSPVGKRLFNTRPVLPTVLRDFSDAPERRRKEAKYRIRAALAELVRRSLIFEGEDEGVYSMHPLIHSYIRDRLGPVNGAIWCEMAQTTLARCVVIEEKLLSGGTSAYFDSRALLSHVHYAMKCQREINQTFVLNREENASFWRFWLTKKPPDNPLPSRVEAFRWIRFSIVYFQCGKAHEAFELQSPVHRMVLRLRGMDHPVTIKLTVLLAITNQWLTNFKESVALQRDVVQASIRLYGEDAPETLKYQDGLGMLLLFHGRLKEARERFRLAHKGFMSLYGQDHKDTLNSMSHVGMVEAMYFNFETARKFCEEAVNGLKKIEGTETELMDAKQNLAMALIRLGKESIDRAYELMDEVFRWRTKHLGRESGHTLLARLNMSRVHYYRGDYYSAEMLLLPGIKVGERDFGDEHYGVLAAKTQLARVLECQSKPKAAEDLYKLVNHKLKVLRDRYDHDHVDRILHLWFMLEFYEKQDRYQDALDIHAEIVEAVETIDRSYSSDQLGKKHRMNEMLIEKKPLLEAGLHKQVSKMTETGSDMRSGSLAIGKKEEEVPLKKLALEGGVNIEAAERSLTPSLPSPPPPYTSLSPQKRSAEDVPRSFRRVSTA